MPKFKPSQFKQCDCSSPGAARQRAKPATLAQYRAAFGQGPGSIHFADQTPFDELCVKEIRRQGHAIAAQEKEIAQLKASNARMQEQLLVIAKRKKASGGTTEKAAAPKVKASKRS